MTWQLVLVHRDGDTKTCVGRSRGEVIASAERVSALHRGAYVASFLPTQRMMLPTSEARRIAERCRTPSS